MLGQRYLETRLDLTDAVDSVRRLARATHAEAIELELDEVASSLKSPLKIVICGEPGAGKSIFASALLGVELGADLIDGSGESLCVYGSSVVWRNAKRHAVAYQQVSGLGEIEVIECRGLSKLSSSEIEILRGFMAQADVVYWLVSSENPWAAKTWESLSEMGAVCVEKSSVILQKVDLLKKKDMEVLVGHLTSLCVQRLGRGLQIHCVSAITAAMAWQSEPRDHRIWKKSGFQICETELDQALNHGAQRRAELQAVSDAAKLVVDRIEKTIQLRGNSLRGYARALQGVEVEVENAREREVLNATENLMALACVLSENVDDTVKFAKRKNGLLSTLVAIFSRGDGALDIEKRLQQGVSEAVIGRSREIAFGLLEKCENHWQGLREGLQNRMAVDVVGFDTATFEKNVERFSERVEKSAKHAMIMLKLRRLLDTMMVARQKALKKMMKWFLLAVSAAGLLGSMPLADWPSLPWIMLAVAGLIAIYMIIFGYHSRAALLTSYYETVQNSRRQLADLLREPYTNEVRYFFSGYTSMFENLRRYIVTSEEKLTPQEELWHNLFLRLKAIDQELR